jgi:hypothetical protein
MPLDPAGLAVTAVQVAGFLLLLIGVYPAKRKEETISLVKHGLFATIVTSINLFTIFAAMVPVFVRIVTLAPAASFTQFPAMWVNAIAGTITVIYAVTMITLWLLKPLGELGCAKTWRLMKPILTTWALAIIIGASIHFYKLT